MKWKRPLLGLLVLLSLNNYTLSKEWDSISDQDGMPGMLILKAPPIVSNVTATITGINAMWGMNVGYGGGAPPSEISFDFIAGTSDPLGAFYTEVIPVSWDVSASPATDIPDSWGAFRSWAIVINGGAQTVDYSATYGPETFEMSYAYFYQDMHEEYEFTSPLEHTFRGYWGITPSSQHSDTCVRYKDKIGKPAPSKDTSPNWDPAMRVNDQTFPCKEYAKGIAALEATYYKAMTEWKRQVKAYWDYREEYNQRQINDVTYEEAMDKWNQADAVYQQAHDNWENANPATRGNEPQPPPLPTAPTGPTQWPSLFAHQNGFGARINVTYTYNIKFVIQPPTINNPNPPTPTQPPTTTPSVTPSVTPTPTVIGTVQNIYYEGGSVYSRFNEQEPLCLLMGVFGDAGSEDADVNCNVRFFDIGQSPFGPLSTFSGNLEINYVPVESTHELWEWEMNDYFSAHQISN